MAGRARGRAAGLKQDASVEGTWGAQGLVAGLEPCVHVCVCACVCTECEVGALAQGCCFCSLCPDPSRELWSPELAAWQSLFKTIMLAQPTVGTGV